MKTPPRLILVPNEQGSRSEPTSSRQGNRCLGKNVALSWINAAFGLQSAPAITGTFTNVPGATSPYTNSLSGGQLFFRLAQ